MTAPQSSDSVFCYSCRMLQDRAVKRNAKIAACVVIAVLLWPLAQRRLPSNPAPKKMDVREISSLAIGDWTSESGTRASFTADGMCRWGQADEEPCGFYAEGNAPPKIVAAAEPGAVYLITGTSGAEKAFRVLAAEEGKLVLESLPTSARVTFVR